MTSRKRGRKTAQKQEPDALEQFIQLGRDKDAGLYGPAVETREQRVYNNMCRQPEADRERVSRMHFDCSWAELVAYLGTWVQEYEDGHARFYAELDRVGDLLKSD